MGTTTISLAILLISGLTISVFVIVTAALFGRFDEKLTLSGQKPLRAKPFRLHGNKRRTKRVDSNKDNVA